MVQVLKNWITSIVVVVIFMSLIDILLPSNSIKKYARLVFGLIIIIIIITPIISLFNKGIDIDAKINDYTKQYNDLNSSKTIEKKNYISSDTIKLFKDNLKEKIEGMILSESGKKYNIIDLKLNEDENSKSFLHIKSIVLKDFSNNNSIKKVAKIDLNNKVDNTNYFWDKEVAYVLTDKFNIDTTVIRFVR